MTTALHFPLVLDVHASVLYPGADGAIIHGQLPVSRAGIVACELRFTNGINTTGALLAVEDNGWLLLVHGYTTAQGHKVVSRGWALEQADSGSKEGFRIRSMLPAGPVSVT